MSLQLPSGDSVLDINVPHIFSSEQDLLENCRFGDLSLVKQILTT